MVKSFLITFIAALFSNIRPLLGPPGACRYELPCTDFALMELNGKTFPRACLSIFIRVLSCNPITNLLIACWHRFT